MKATTIRRAMVLAVACTVLTLSGAMSAFADAPLSSDNTTCRGCHEARRPGAAVPVATFSDGVNYTLCRSCHWIDGNVWVDAYRHKHVPGSDCQRCHFGMGDRGPDYRPVVRTSSGFFSTRNIRSMSAAQIHAVHVNGSWPQSGTAVANGPNYCNSCHAPAACDACHVTQAGHRQHGMGSAASRTAAASPSRLVANGTRIGVTWVPTAVGRSQTCLSVGCHGTGLPAPAPACSPCHTRESAGHRPAK
ncbi:MAG: hypothetical protein Q7W30_06165 [Coriobacteriia bacterium]|nr:hypothetical protein [Coriobacteriia bacterium]